MGQARAVIEFRDRHWFRKRSAQIPDSWIEVWRQAFKKNRTLDIAELAQIAALTQEQFNVNIKGDEVLSCTAASSDSDLSTIVMFKQDLLRAYGALTENERKDMFSESGLALEQLPADERALWEKSIYRRNAALLQDKATSITLHGECVHQGKQLEYTITATTSDAMNPIVWTFTTPKYEPPKKADSIDKP